MLQNIEIPEGYKEVWEKSCKANDNFINGITSSTEGFNQLDPDMIEASGPMIRDGGDLIAEIKDSLKAKGYEADEEFKQIVVEKVGFEQPEE